MRWSKMLTVVGAHAEGEVGQVITGGVTGVPGATMGDKMRHLNEVDDRLRRFTLFEPRGNPHMSVNLLLPPTRPDADAGFIVMQADRCHPMSGSNAMSVVTVLLETGMLPMQEPTTRVALDTPAGLVVAAARCRDGRCERVALEFVPSFALHLDHALEVDGLGTLAVDVAWGGDWFCLVDAVSCGFAVRPDEVRDMIELGGRIKRAAHEQIALRHPTMPETGNISFAMFCARPEAPGAPYRNGTVMHPGRMDRSPVRHGYCRPARGDARARRDRRRRDAEHAFGDRQRVPGDAHRRHDARRTPGGAAAHLGARLDLRPVPAGPRFERPLPLGYTLADAWGPCDA